LCWREDGLYGAVAAEDRTLKVDPGAPWEADCVELFLEQDYARSPSRTKNTAQYVFAPAADLVPGRGHMQVAYGPYEGKESKTGIACAWRPTESGYALEFHIPAAVLAPARMEEGCKVGMNFVRNDDGRPVELFYTSKAPDGYRTPIAWGALELTR
jgi:hypothetical protein